jgi:hypothetical protein
LKLPTLEHQLELCKEGFGVAAMPPSIVFDALKKTVEIASAGRNSKTERDRASLNIILAAYRKSGLFCPTVISDLTSDAREWSNRVRENRVNFDGSPLGNWSKF